MRPANNHNDSRPIGMLDSGVGGLSVLQEVRREIIGHSSQRSRDVNDRYTQIELPEKRDAIRKLEIWYDAQIAELAQTETAPAETQEP